MSLDRGPVAVVGGGIAGLAAAYELCRQGRRFLLLEQADRWGGIIRTERTEGFLLEAGPDTLLAQKPAALELVRELGLGERLVPTNPDQRTVFVLRRGRLYPLPDGMMLGVPTRLWPLARTRLFSWPGKLRMALDLVLPRRREEGEESIAKFLRRRLGRQALARLGGPFLAGIHAGDPERLSLQATFPRLAELEDRHRSLIRGLVAARPRHSGPAPPTFYSLQRGLGELVEALVARLPADCLHLRSSVRRLRSETDGFTLGLDGGQEVWARDVVLALPAPRAAELLAAVEPRVAALLHEIPFASTAAVYVGYRRQEVRHPLDGHGFIVAEGERLHLSACTFFSTKFPGRAPRHHVLLRAFLGGARDPGALDQTDDAMAARVHRELAPVLGLEAPPLLFRVYRWPSATPQLEVGHLARVAEVESRLSAIPGLLLTGAGVRGTGIPDTIADARRVARLLA